MANKAIGSTIKASKVIKKQQSKVAQNRQLLHRVTETIMLIKNEDFLQVCLLIRLVHINLRRWINNKKNISTLGVIDIILYLVKRHLKAASFYRY